MGFFKDWIMGTSETSKETQDEIDKERREDEEERDQAWILGNKYQGRNPKDKAGPS